MKQGINTVSPVIIIIATISLIVCILLLIKRN
jgi:hypothetical protein